VPSSTLPPEDLLGPTSKYKLTTTTTTTVQILTRRRKSEPGNLTLETSKQTSH
jgi:hypothetical protein